MDTFEHKLGLFQNQRTSNAESTIAYTQRVQKDTAGNGGQKMRDLISFDEHIHKLFLEELDKMERERIPEDW